MSGNVVPIRPDLAIAATVAEDQTRAGHTSLTSTEQAIAYRLAQACDIAIAFANQAGAPMHARFVESAINDAVDLLLKLDRQHRAQ